MKARARSALIACLAVTAGWTRPGTAQTVDFTSLEGRPSTEFELPEVLEEISGLAWHPDGFLLTHNDEFGIIYFLNPRTGEIDGERSLGLRNATGDFEGITLTEGARATLVTSEGRLTTLHLTSGEITTHHLGLGNVCEVEGLATARSGTELILACKTLYQGSDRDALVLLVTPDPATGRAAAAEVLLRIGSDALRRADVPRPFYASGVEVVDEGYLILSARRALVLLVSEAGAILDVAQLDTDRHGQAEGITVDAGGGLWVADEGGGERARLTRYGGK